MTNQFSGTSQIDTLTPTYDIGTEIKDVLAALKGHPGRDSGLPDIITQKQRDQIYATTKTTSTSNATGIVIGAVPAISGYIVTDSLKRSVEEDLMIWLLSRKKENDTEQKTTEQSPSSTEKS